MEKKCSETPCGNEGSHGRSQRIFKDNLSAWGSLLAKSEESHEIWTILMRSWLKDGRAKDFLHYVPMMHKYFRNRQFLNSHDNVCDYYCEDVLKNGISEDAEMTFVYDGSLSKNVLLSLHKHGHKFSLKAQEEIKKRCPDIYESLCGK